MIKRFWHIGFAVEDLEKAIAQYEMLGFQVDQRYQKEAPKCVAAHLTHPDGSGLEIFQWTGDDHPHMEYIEDHMGFITDDIDADIVDLTNRGMKLVIPKAVGVTVSYFAFLKAPDGRVIELVQL